MYTSPDIAKVIKLLLENNDRILIYFHGKLAIKYTFLSNLYISALLKTDKYMNYIIYVYPT